MKNIVQRTGLLTTLLFITSFTIHATLYEAEDALLFRAVTETTNSGYSGESYVNFDNEAGSYIEFTIGMAEAGNQTLTFRYANNGTSARPMSVMLNGTTLGQQLSFELTGGWTIWVTESISLDLLKGINKVRLTSLSSDGGPNLDNSDVSGVEATRFSLEVIVVGPGSILQEPPGSSFYDGETVSLTATPGLLGEFAGWSGDLSGSNLIELLTINSDKSVTALFNEITVETGDPDFSMTGFATVSGEGLETTTGGEGGAITTVTTLQELMDYAKEREDETSPGILYIKGKISSPSTTVVTFKHGENITILGEGEFGELENVGLRVWDYKNVIIRNLKIHEVLYPNDAITIDECQHVWVDHNELYSKIGSGIGVDTYDGLLDIKNGSRYVTVSWNIVHHHMKTSLIGHTDNSGQASTDSQFRITYHHNYFHDTDGRNPSIRFGAIHLYNNYFENITDYGIAVRQGAHALLENNHYHSVVIPITTNKFDGPDGFVCESGTIYTGTSSAGDNSITQTDCDFWNDLPYIYTPEPANTVALMVQQHAGVGKIYTGSSVFLSDITVSEGALVPAFNTNITQYNLVLAAGTESITIEAVSVDEGAVITGDGEISTIPSTVVITVESGDGSSSETYYINISYAAVSSNANLASLSVSPGELTPQFDPSISEYELVVPVGTEAVIFIAESEHEGAGISGTGEFSQIPGTAGITVTAEDGTVKIYQVEISLSTTTETFSNTETVCYPNPVTDKLLIRNLKNGTIEIINVNGQLIRKIPVIKDFEIIEMGSYNPGIYLLKISSNQTIEVIRILKR